MTTLNAKTIAAGLTALVTLSSCSGPGSAGSGTQAQTQDIPLVRDAATGARYGAPGPRSCTSRHEPQSSALSAVEARAYVICDNEGLNGDTLLLFAKVSVSVSPGRPYNYATDNFQGIDTSKPVYDIHGSSVNYTCVTPDPERTDFQPCTRIEDPNAQGRCFQDADADWHCSWTASVSASTDTRLRVPAPTMAEAD